MIKKHPNTLWAIGATLLVAVLIIIGLGDKPVAASSLPRERHPDIEVEPALQNRLNAGEGDFSYLIYFQERPDLSAAYDMDWESRGRFVVDALQATAQESQRGVRAYLDQQGVHYQAYWVDNVIVVQRGSSAATFNGLLVFPEIQALRARRRITIHNPLPGTIINADITDIEPNLIHVGANLVWDMGITGEGITVANIDTGVLYTHEALRNQYRGNLGGSYDHNYNWWDPPLGGSNVKPVDNYGHGSHTMGIMVGDDGDTNMIGMAPGADWIACQAFEAYDPDYAYGDDLELLECGQFMLAPWDLNGENPNPDLRPHIVNNSWGDCEQSLDSWFKGVVASWHAAGIYPVFSNGNASNCGYSTPPGLNTVGNPARYGDVTGVGSTTRDTGIYYPGSNWGPTDDLDTINPSDFPNIKPQVVAPGQNIRSAVENSNDAYTFMTGTSMAAPHVAGLVALMWEAAPCLIGDYATTETIMMQTANPIPYDTQNGDEGDDDVPNHATGWGEIDAPAAVQEAMSNCYLDTSPLSQQVCAPGEGSYQIVTNLAFPGTVDLSVSGLPSGGSAALVPHLVTPRATSTLTVTLSALAADGDYPLHIQGVSGAVSYTDTVTLGVRTEVPGQPNMISPVDGTIRVSEKPLLVWESDPFVEVYQLEIALDANFSTLVYYHTVAGNAHQVADWLDYNTRYYWRVTPQNVCGQGATSQVFTFTTRTAPPVLLVDDDDNDPDVSAAYIQTLESLGIAYAYWDITPLMYEPDTDFLSNFYSVVWFTGDNYQPWTGPNHDGEDSLAAWLDSGGCLLFTSQDYQYARGITGFMLDYLGVTAVTDNIYHTSVTGNGSVFGDLGSFSLSYPFENYSDGLTPRTGAEVAFTSLAGSAAAVNWDSGTFKTTYWGYPFEALSTPTDRASAMKAFLDWCQLYRVNLPVVFR